MMKSNLKNAVISLSPPGLASIVSFASETTKLLNLVKPSDYKHDITDAIFFYKTNRNRLLR